MPCRFSATPRLACALELGGKAAVAAHGRPVQDNARARNSATVRAARQAPWVSERCEARRRPVRRRSTRDLRARAGGEADDAAAAGSSSSSSPANALPLPQPQNHVQAAQQAPAAPRPGGAGLRGEPGTRPATGGQQQERRRRGRRRAIGGGQRLCSGACPSPPARPQVLLAVLPGSLLQRADRELSTLAFGSSTTAARTTTRRWTTTASRSTRRRPPSRRRCDRLVPCRGLARFTWPSYPLG